ncbi:MAG TPA: PilZ domain-containing protein [Polyangiaceae bacterium]|jgi:Tfp pilus assembly protein PilZ
MSFSDSAGTLESSHFRAVSRHAVNLLGSLRASEALWNRDVHVIDLGLGGARVEAPETIEAGTVVELVIETPHLWEPLKLQGAVAWARALPASDGAGAQIGVRFEHAGGRSVRTLSDLLEAEAFS